MKQKHQDEVSSKELTRRLNSHYNNAHEEGSVSPENCAACESLKKLIQKAEERERLHKI